MQNNKILLEETHVDMVLQRLFASKTSKLGQVTALQRERKLIKYFLMQELSSYIQQLADFQGKQNRGSGVELLRFAVLTDSFIGQCHILENELNDRLLIKRIQLLFQELINSWYATNHFMRRCLEKPQGYPGDYITLEMIYDYNAQPVNQYGFFDHYLLSHANCVRTRKEKLKLYLKDFISRRFGHNNVITILTLGSGSCREWFELVQTLTSGIIPRIRLVCLDRDSEALEFSRTRLSDNRLLQTVECLNQSLVAFSSVNSDFLKIESFDLIYTVGTLDYFYDESLKKILLRSLALLKTGGELLITHKDFTRFQVAPSEWLCSWSFVSRDEKLFSLLVENSLLNSDLALNYRIERDESGQIIFSVLEKYKETLGTVNYGD